MTRAARTCRLGQARPRGGGSPGCSRVQDSQPRQYSPSQPHLKVLLAGGGRYPCRLLKLLPRAQQEALPQQLLACRKGQGRGPERRGGRMWAAAAYWPAVAWQHSR
jgi:hypothetical protein